MRTLFELYKKTIINNFNNILFITTDKRYTY